MFKSEIALDMMIRACVLPNSSHHSTDRQQIFMKFRASRTTDGTTNDETPTYSTIDYQTQV